MRSQSEPLRTKEAAMKSISLGAPQSTRSLSSFFVRVGKSTMTPGRFTFLRSLQSRMPSQLVSSHTWLFSCSAFSGGCTAACKRASQGMEMHSGTCQVPCLDRCTFRSLQEKAAQRMPGICSLQPQVHCEQGNLLQWGAWTAPATRDVLSCLHSKSLHSKQPFTQEGSQRRQQPCMPCCSLLEIFNDVPGVKQGSSVPKASTHPREALLRHLHLTMSLSG